MTDIDDAVRLTEEQLKSLRKEGVDVLVQIRELKVRLAEIDLELAKNRSDYPLTAERRAYLEELSKELSNARDLAAGSRRFQHRQEALGTFAATPLEDLR